MLRRQIAGLGAVRFEVVEFPCAARRIGAQRTPTARIFGDEFPPAAPDSLVALVLPEHRASRVDTVFAERRSETPALGRNGFQASDRIGIFAAGQFEECGHKIGDTENAVAESAFVGDFSAP